MTPNISTFSQQAFIFPNYHVVSSPCTPSRAAILTGLYPQQTCIFLNQDKPPSQTPVLLPYNSGWTADGTNGGPGFPTIGNVLSQTIPDASGGSSSYNCAWIGKWHLSDNGIEPGALGGDGPFDYGFSNPFNIPNPPDSATYPAIYASPSGSVNEANGGNTLLGTPSASMSLMNYYSPGFPTGTAYDGSTYPPAPSQPSYNQLNDTAIWQAFKHYWLANPPAEPWFCAVSFINPHDISRFPWAYGLAGTTSDFPDPPSAPDELGFYSPSTDGVTDSCTAPCNALDVKPLTTVYGPSNAPPGGNWNADDPLMKPYLGCDGSAQGKPGLQAFFEYDFDQTTGTIAPTGTAWTTFLNYYFWMQQCADTLFNDVWQYLKANNPFANPILIVFSSDHGDFGGSHCLHSKGGALYDECTNVPLYISFLRNRMDAPVVRPFVCSSVDLLPFFYSMALGNEGWRCSGTNDMIGYLGGRESIMDAIYSDAPLQRRLSNLPNSAGAVNGQSTQPYVLSADQYSSAPFETNATCGEGSLTNQPQPSHAIGFRTVDLSVNPSPASDQNNPIPFSPASSYGPFGGGKLGMYSFWNTGGSISGSPCGTGPVLGNAEYPMQFEFYNDANGNFAELGNDAFDSPGVWDSTAVDFICAYNAIMCGELYDIAFPTGYGTLQQQMQAAYAQALSDYLAAVGGDASCPPPTTCPGSVPTPSGDTCPG